MSLNHDNLPIHLKDLQPKLDEIVATMIADFNSRYKMPKMQEEYATKFRYDVGRNYIKLVQDNSVRMFIVISKTDKQFKYGDLLLPKSWAAPARNHARGNVFTGYAVSCYGVPYMP